MILNAGNFLNKIHLSLRSYQKLKKLKYENQK